MDQLVDVLKQHRGRANAIRVSEIARALDWHESDRSYPRLRSRILKAIEGGLPVGSCQRGYFLIETHQELGDYITTLRRRRREIEARIFSVYDAFAGYAR